jgi:cation diffusion facilitator CzcD-associated flavoprotein CzcO/acetyl esterase/lipase
MTAAHTSSPHTDQPEQTAILDALIVGAGFSGMYLLHRLRGAGMSVRVLEAADDVGGTWYWNRYPGARCDIPTTDYTFGFDPTLEQRWTWSEKYATQPEILRYAQFVADTYDLRGDISFVTRAEAAVWDEDHEIWVVHTDRGEEIRCRHYVMATGCLSVPKSPDIAGTDTFDGAVYFTGRWPHEGVDFTGLRVAVIGTGSSGIQSIPLIAREAAQLTVFQRTPNFSIPARNGAVAEEKLAPLLADRDGYRTAAKYSRGGIPGERPEISALTAPEDVRRERFEAAWQAGELFEILGVFNDQMVSPQANDIVAEMIREKIRAVVNDPTTAELLCPKDHPLGSKRPCLDSGYFETFNLPHVRLVDLRSTPIRTITATGIDLTSPDGHTESLEFDAIVFATGFDAMTGAVVAVDIVGSNGITLKQKWADGPLTYLGLTTTGFPNFYTITGPGSPSVLSNMMVSIEQHVDWLTDLFCYMRDHNFTRIEPTPTAEAGWVQHVNDCADITLFPTANSWYMGANVPGKPRVFLPYVGGVDYYRMTCEKAAAEDYFGFQISGPDHSICNDGVINRLQPDVRMVLDVMAEMQLPPLESMSPSDARTFMDMSAGMRPSGPQVGEIIDGRLPGAADDLDYRLYRPASPGPHPVVVYFHGGGWVLGSAVSDDPLCRDLCLRSDAVIVSVDYRHAPEARFPAAAEDAYAATCWVADHAADLGGIPGQIAVAGWSAGANLAAVTAVTARDRSGPRIIGQMLMTPVTDGDMSRGSYAENGEGYVLTASLMRWFWDHYADAEDRQDPRVAVLRTPDLSGLPPAMIVTAEFDPLRDEGIAYAEALAAAGVPVQHCAARGHTHTSISMVDVVISGRDIRAQMADSLRGFFTARVSS